MGSDLRYAWRSIWKSPATSVGAMLALALGIGATTTIFGLLNAALLRPLPYPQADRLVELWGNVQRDRLERRGASFPDYFDWRDQSRSFDAMAAWFSNGFIIYGAGWILIFLLVAWLYQRAWATRDSLQLTPLESYDAITYARHYLGFVLAGVISILVALTGVGLGFGLPGMMYATIGLFAWLNFRAREPERERLATTVVQHPQLANTGAIDTSLIREALK